MPVPIQMSPRIEFAYKLKRWTQYDKTISESITTLIFDSPQKLANRFIDRMESK